MSSLCQCMQSKHKEVLKCLYLSLCVCIHVCIYVRKYRMQMCTYTYIDVRSYEIIDVLWSIYVHML